MSTRSPDQHAQSRADARRRARLAARGDLPDEDSADTIDETPPSSSGNFLTRLFPPAPPLPDKPDPLAGFDRDRPLRPIRERLFLLRRNLVAWIVPGIVAFVGAVASASYARGILGLLGTLLLFGALVGAGWFGWQRPTLYGTVASIVGYLLSTGLIMYSLAVMGAGPDTFGPPSALALQLVINGLIQAGLGFLGGWYGGYLRRRQTQLSGAARASRRGRR